jgi:hypothetical protein
MSIFKEYNLTRKGPRLSIICVQPSSSKVPPNMCPTLVKAISDEIKAKYGIGRGNKGIRISEINDPTT